MKPEYQAAFEAMTLANTSTVDERIRELMVAIWDAQAALRGEDDRHPLRAQLAADRAELRSLWVERRRQVALAVGL